MQFDKYDRRGAYHWRNVAVTNSREFNPVVATRYEKTMKLVPRQAVRILDVGCGDAYLPARLAMEGKEAVGVDLSLAGLAAGRVEIQKNFRYSRMPAPTLVVASGYALPFADRRFSAVLATEIVEHVNRPEFLLQEVRRVLAPSGVFIVSTPNRQPCGRRDVHHTLEYTAKELRQLLNKTFSHVRVFGLGDIRLLNWHRRCSRIPFWKRCIRILCSAGLNPFAYPFGIPDRNSNLLFAVSRG